MNLFNKIIALYPQLNEGDFAPNFGTIALRNDLDSRGDYIDKWEHPTFPKPTDEQLAGVQ